MEEAVSELGGQGKGGWLFGPEIALLHCVRMRSHPVANLCNLAHRQASIA